MLRIVTGLLLGAGLLASPAAAQTTTSTVLTGEAFGFVAQNSTMPDPFPFTALTGVEPDGIARTSEIVTISGITEPVSLSVTDGGGGGSPNVSINGQIPVTTGTINEGDQIRASIVPELNGFGRTYQAVVAVGDGSSTFTVTTRNAITDPAPFTFAAANNQDPGVTVPSAPATITGIEAPASVTVAGHASAEVSVDGGTSWSPSASVANNGNVLVRLVSGTFGETRSATVTVGTVSATFQVITRSSNENPVFASFDPVTNADPSATVTSGPVTVTGIETTVTASVSGDGLPELRVNGGSWVLAGEPATISNNDTIAVRLTSGAFGVTRVATLDVNGVTGDFSVTTRVADTVPDAFAITAVTGATANTQVTSGPITITGIEADAVVTVSGEGTPFFSTDAGVSWVGVGASGLVGDNGEILVRLTSGTFGATRVATLTVGGVSADFSVTSAAQDTTPDLFAFTPLLAAPDATVTSNQVTLSGFDGAVGISISGHVSALYRIGTGDFTSDPGTVTAGQLVEVRLTASGTGNAERDATLTVGTGGATFTVTTQDLTPDLFAFAAVTGAALNTTTPSNASQITGISGTVPISVSEGNAAFYRVGTGPEAEIVWGDWLDHTQASGVTNESWVQVRLTSSNVFETERSLTLTVGNGSAGFSVTTGSEPVTVSLATGFVPDGEEAVAYGGFDFRTLVTLDGGPSASPPAVADLVWAVSSGALPTGITLNTSTGFLSGTPTAVGSFGFFVTAAYEGTVSDPQSYTITINDPDGSLELEIGG